MGDLIMKYHDFLELFVPYWGELFGIFFMVVMLNIINSKGSQRETFRLFSFGFYTIAACDLIKIIAGVPPLFDEKMAVVDSFSVYTSLFLMVLAMVFFIAGALKNMHLYFSAPVLIGILTFIFSTISILVPAHNPLGMVGRYLPPIYLTLGLLLAGASFYVAQRNTQSRAIRTLGTGFIVLAIGYSYQAFNLLQNNQQNILLCYTLATVLSLASQLQYLNVCVEQTEGKLEAEKKSKRETWEISPFPIIISRLRDDSVVYMNPVAIKMLGLAPEEVKIYKMKEYFVDPKRKEDLIIELQRRASVSAFEAQVHHPKLNNLHWIDITTRTTDLDDEIVLYTTFKDITDQKEVARKLQEQAATDPLTGLFNRRQFEILATQALQTAERYKNPFSIAMLDIDFFKKINDTYGHDAGDLVLKNLAKTLVKTLRKADIVARYGGEEFVIFLSQTNPAEGRIAMEHVREAVQKMETITRDKKIDITISIGISEMQTFNLMGLVKQADDALYFSKKNGRNRVSLYRDLSAGTKVAYPQPTAKATPVYPAPGEKAKPVYPTPVAKATSVYPAPNQEKPVDPTTDGQPK